MAFFVNRYVRELGTQKSADSIVVTAWAMSEYTTGQYYAVELRYAADGNFLAGRCACTSG